LFDHKVELELVLGLVEVVLAAVDDTGAECTAWNFTDFTSASGVLIGNGGGILILDCLFVKEEESSLAGLVGVDVGHAVVVLVVNIVDAESTEESGDVLDELDGLLPGADIGIDFVEKVSDTLGRVFQTAFSVVAIGFVSAVLVVVSVPGAVPSSGEGTLITGVLVAVLNSWLNSVSGRGWFWLFWLGFGFLSSWCLGWYIDWWWW